MYDRHGSWEHVHHDFAWEYLGGGHNDVNTAHDMILDSEHWDHCTTPPKIDFAVQVLLKYKLLDILANVLGCEAHPERKIYGQVPYPKLPNRMEKVSYTCACSTPCLIFFQLRTSISDWPLTVEKFNDIMKNGADDRPMRPISIFSTGSSSSPSAHLQILETGLASLLSASRHVKEAKFHKAMVNIKFLVFALCWFGMVTLVMFTYLHILTLSKGQVYFPDDDEKFIEAIVGYVAYVLSILAQVKSFIFM